MTHAECTSRNTDGIVIGKKMTENGVEIYHNGKFVATLTVEEIEELYKGVKHAYIEKLKERS